MGNSPVKDEVSASEAHRQHMVDELWDELEGMDTPVVPSITIGEWTKRMDVLYLDVQGHKLSSEETNLLCDQLEDNAYITSIDLSRTSLDESKVNAVSAMLLKNKVIKTVHLSGNPLGNASVSILCLTLQRRPVGVEWLYLQDVDLDVNGIVSLCTFLETDKRLQHLTLSCDVRVCATDTPTALTSLVSAIRRNVGLRNLTLDHWSGLAVVDTMVAIGNAIGCNQSLRSVSLKHCNLDDEMVKTLFDALSYNQFIGSIDVSENPITSASVEAAVALVERNVVVESVHLGVELVRAYYMAEGGTRRGATVVEGNTKMRCDVRQRQYRQALQMLAICRILAHVDRAKSVDSAVSVDLLHLIATSLPTSLPPIVRHNVWLWAKHKPSLWSPDFWLWIWNDRSGCPPSV